MCLYEQTFGKEKDASFRGFDISSRARTPMLLDNFFKDLILYSSCNVAEIGHEPLRHDNDDSHKRSGSMPRENWI